MKYDVTREIIYMFIFMNLKKKRYENLWDNGVV